MELEVGGVARRGRESLSRGEDRGHRGSVLSGVGDDEEKVQRGEKEIRGVRDSERLGIFREDGRFPPDLREGVTPRSKACLWVFEDAKVYLDHANGYD